MDQKDNVNNMESTKCPNCEHYKELASVSLELLTYAMDPARTPFDLMTIRMQLAEMFNIQNQIPPSDHTPSTHKTGS